jgi:hypothetical protein
MMQTNPSNRRDGATSMRRLLDDREQRIRLSAYFLVEGRGFAPGQALDDWLAAERDEDARWRPLHAD